MSKAHAYNSKFQPRNASFDSEEEGHGIADEQMGQYLASPVDQEEYCKGTQEHDMGGRQPIESFVTPIAFDKNSVIYRKNKFVVGGLKGSKQVQTTKNSVTRRINVAGLSPPSQKAVGVGERRGPSRPLLGKTSEAPMIQNLPPSIVLNSKQGKLAGSTQYNSTAQFSFARNPMATGSFQHVKKLTAGTHVKNSPSRLHELTRSQRPLSLSQNKLPHEGQGPALRSPTKPLNFDSPAQQQLRKQRKVPIQLKELVRSGNEPGSIASSPRQATAGQKYSTLQQNVKSQYSLLQQQNTLKQQSQVKNKVQIRSANKITIKTKCVSLQVSAERDPHAQASGNQHRLKAAFQSPQQHPEERAQEAEQPNESVKIQIMRRPMVSQTMKNSQLSLGSSTPVREKPTPKPSGQLTHGPLKPNEPEDHEFSSAKGHGVGVYPLHNPSQTHILPVSVHNIQLTRNTQAPAKTVSHVASVLNTKYHVAGLAKKGLSQTKSVALSLDQNAWQGSEQGPSRVGSICTSLSQLNKNLNLRLDKSSSKMNNEQQSEREAKQFGSPSPPNSILIQQMTVSPSLVAMMPLRDRNALLRKESEESSNKGLPGSLSKRTPGPNQKLKINSQTVQGAKSSKVSALGTQTKATVPRALQHYVSKTAQASAYASKNHSNNSSVVRGATSSGILARPGQSSVQQHFQGGSKLNVVLKKKKPVLSTQNSNLGQDEGLGTNAKSILGSSHLSFKQTLSLHQAQTPLPAKKHLPQPSVGGPVSLSSTTANLQARTGLYSTGGKSLKSTIAKNKQAVHKQLASTGTGSHHFASQSMQTLKKQTVKKTGTLGKTDVKGTLARRERESLNGSLNLRLGRDTDTKVAKHSEHRGLIKKDSRRPKSGKSSIIENASRPISQNPSEDNSFNDMSPQTSGIYNTTQVQKKKFQPSQGQGSGRRKQDGYRRAGYTVLPIGQSIEEQKQPGNPMISFNDIQEEVRETESIIEVQQPTFHIDDSLKQQMKWKLSPGSIKLRHSQDSDDSLKQQIQEYKKDISKLKKLIKYYFQEQGKMKPSSCDFYRIGRVLGRGAFGKVHLACHKVTEHLVAVKALQKKVLDHEKDTKKRVMQEIAILKQSSHTNVVKLYDSFETHNHICFVMELCQGGDLISYVRKRRKLKEDNAKYLFRQLIEGLNYIHNEKFVVHRDIKLDNILLDASGRIKICDFGVSRQVKSERERMQEQCGTPAYIAPEIIARKGYKGFKSDMWSAGVCLYVMLIGTVPFRAHSIAELHQMIKRGKYSFQGEVLSAEAKNLLSSLINFNHHKRLSARECLKHPWFKTSQETGKPIDYNRADLAEVIFTQKEIETIHKDYITRLEKLKQQRFKKDAVAERGQDPRYTTGLSKLVTDDDMLFTEHHLDTKEDQQLGLPDKNKKVVQLFSKQSNPEFQKFEGLLKNKPVQNFPIELAQNLENNVSEKSIIYAPFNSSFSDFDEEHPDRYEWPDSVKELLQPKRSKIVKFSQKCRDLNREYEGNNNADLDNGVYNAFVNEQEIEAEKQHKMKKDGLVGNGLDLDSGNRHSSSDSLQESMQMTSFSSDGSQSKVRLEPDQSEVQQEISIHETMQRGHEETWKMQANRTVPKQQLAIDGKMVDHTIEIFKSGGDASGPVYGLIKRELVTALQAQELNYLTAAYYLSLKYEKE